MGLLHTILLAMGLASPMIGDCVGYQWDGRNKTDCVYPAGKIDDGLRSAIGRQWGLGPWATEDNDIVWPAIILLAGPRTIVLNGEFGGHAILTVTKPGSLISNNQFQTMIGASPMVSFSSGAFKRY